MEVVLLTAVVASLFVVAVVMVFDLRAQKKLRREWFKPLADINDLRADKALSLSAISPEGFEAMAAWQRGGEADERVA